jgi:hypothetical protein
VGSELGNKFIPIFGMIRLIDSTQKVWQ